MTCCVLQVTVQAGCRVQQVADALAPHGLTLQNYASIRDQQIGGFVQVCPQHEVWGLKRGGWATWGKREDGVCSVGRGKDKFAGAGSNGGALSVQVVGF